MAQLAIGDKVLVKYEDGEWYKAKVVKLHKDATVTVRWTEDDYNERVQLINVKKKEKKSQGVKTTPDPISSGKLPWKQVPKPLIGGLVLFRHPKTNQEMFGIGVGGGQTLKVWEPTVGSRFRQWLIPWTNIVASYALVFPHGAARRGIDLTRNAYSYFEEKFANGKFQPGVSNDLNEWAIKRLKVGMNVSEERRSPEFGGLMGYNGWQITAIRGTMVDLQGRIIDDKAKKWTNKLDPNEKRTLPAIDVFPNNN